MRRPNVFTIPAGAHFLPKLVRALLDGRFGEIDRTDPAALADVTILLPTRRAARALRDELIRAAPAQAAILPRIRPIGDVDEEEQLLAAGNDEPGDRLILPPAISRFDRLLTLTRLILAWSEAMRAEALPGGEQHAIPSSAGDAIRLAGDLARLIDDMETAGIDWQRLEQLAPDEHAGYWQLTLQFLKIAGEQWPRFLAEQGRADPAVRRDQLLRQAAERLTMTPPRGPIIAAGSTGSIPATAALLKAIAHLPNGAVVLPALDQTLDAASWEAIGDPADPRSGAPSHPQFGLKRLLAEIGIVRDDVEPLAKAPEAAARRAAIVAEALRPAETTEAWSGATPPARDALDGIALLIARNENEEALAIAAAMRESLETAGTVSALVTPDRSLAERVAVELRRWNVAIDDSAGQVLQRTAKGIFVRLAAEAALAKDIPALLALARHPLARFDLSPRRCRRAANALEVAIMRGAGGFNDIRSLDERLANIRLQTDMRVGGITPKARRRLTKQDWAMAEELAANLRKALGPLEALCDRRTVPTGELASALLDALRAAAGEMPGMRSELWADRDGEAIAALLAGLATSDGMAIAPAEFPGFLTALLANETAAPEPIGDPRIHIWGTLEARLQSVDLLILAGLDEGVWPAQIRTDPWLSRRMRDEIGLPPPERRLGLAAHDFAQGMAAERVIVTRSERRGGSPTVASRWWQRFETVIGEEHSKALEVRGERYRDIARQLDSVAPHEVRPVVRPAPTPPLTARPAELSVTSIETLIRDPYAVYARRVLQLEPLDPIGQRADARIRGSLIHEAFAEFTTSWSGPYDGRARDAFLGYWRKHFRDIAAYPEVHAVWLLRAEPIADWLIDWEARRDADIASRHAEKEGKLSLDIGGEAFSLRGRADRIDVFKDGSIGIYDYKTGILASPKQVLLFQPQLALEGAMARLGAFGEAFAERPIAELAWIGLALVGKKEPLNSAVDTDYTPDSVSTEALARLTHLIRAYRDPDKGYVSQARPMFERRFPGDYDHLARVSEWRNAIEATR